MADWLTNSNASASRDAPAFWRSSQPRAVSRLDLNDPQILLLELAHGMLIDTETTSTARTATGRSPSCPVDGRPSLRVPGHRSHVRQLGRRPVGALGHGRLPGCYEELVTAR